MLSPWIYLMMNGLFFTLRLSGGSGSFPRPLKAAEEREYLERAAQGDLEARNLLVEHNLRLVAHIVKKYYAQTGDQDDLISIGTIGLIKGISTFKSDKNVRLATYACRKVRHCVATCLTDRERSIITLRYGLDDRPPRTQREIASRCGISRSYVSRIEKRALEKLEQAMRE